MKCIVEGWLLLPIGKQLIGYTLLILLSVSVSVLYVVHTQRINYMESIKFDARSTAHEDNAVQNLTMYLPPKKRKDRFVYIKIAKTGSTTFANVFSSYAYHHRLNMMMATNKHKSINTRQMKRGMSWNVGPREHEPPDMAFQHASYNHEFHTTHFPNDTVFITSVRDVPRWFISYVDYMQLFKDNSPKEVLEKDALFFKKKPATMINLKCELHNSFLQWLGFDEDKSSDLQAIEDYIQFIDKQFYLVMITEYFDESLVLLRRMMNWSMADIFYKYANEGGTKSGTVLTPKELAKLTDADHNLGDSLLYQHFNRTFWQKVGEQKGLLEEVDLFRSLQQKVYDYCFSKGLQMDKSLRLRLVSPWEGEFYVTEENCLAVTIVPGHHKPLTNALDKYVSFRYNFTGVEFRKWDKNRPK